MNSVPPEAAPPQVPNPPLIITSPNTDELRIKQTITDVVGRQAIEYTNRILRYLFVAIVGALAAIVWNLNGQIYQAVGATGVSSKALELEINRLREEVNKLQGQARISGCLNDKKVTDKAGCYRGN